eukprot:363364-Chlamydomonas_euryale.AAC.6
MRPGMRGKPRPSSPELSALIAMCSMPSLSGAAADVRAAAAVHALSGMAPEVDQCTVTPASPVGAEQA